MRRVFITISLEVYERARLGYPSCALQFAMGTESRTLHGAATYLRTRSITYVERVAAHAVDCAIFRTFSKGNALPLEE